jgi:hypothetical protein
MLLGGDDGHLPLHLTTNYPKYKEIKEITDIINT